ncbi:hypothetical protein GF312_18855 [Candidatus Poribacteria bacterium]|nr:hypothetical protein [Candidatus Poribacteria bacterium]
MEKKYIDEEKSRSSTFRAILLGVVLIIISAYWVVGVENRIVYELTDFSIYPTVIFVVFILALLNLILIRYLKRFALRPGEMATIYIMLSIATSLFGHDIMRQLIPMMTNPFWFATPENEWEDLFFRYIPRWLTVDNKYALEEYYKGESNFFTEQNLRAWFVPIVAWTGFIVVFLFGTLCINLIVRKQWTEHEKLSYPIIRLPLELSNEPKKFFSNKFLWIGFTVTALIELLAGLHYLYPVIPSLRIKIDIGRYLTNKPWNTMRPIHINIYGFAMGLSYFMPLALSFSLWFFHLFWKVQLAIFSVLGWRSGGGWQSDQRFGAWMGIGLLALFTSRNHLKDTIVKFIKGDQEEGGMYRFAYIGALFSAVFITLFWYRAGSSIWAIILYFGIYMVLCVAISRMRAELGPPTHELHNARPDRMMSLVVGSRGFGAANLTNYTLMGWMSYGYRCHPMPHQLEGLKLSERLGMRNTTLIIAMMVAALVGSLASFGSHLGFYYRYPNYAIWGRGEFGHLGNILTNPMTRDMTAITQMSFGFGFTILLMALSRRYIWWPFHPVGYAVGSGWAIGHMWFSVFLSWLAKRMILSYGGSKVYRKAIPIFLGLILGQFFMGSFWSVLGLILNRNMYTLFP